MSQKSLTKIRSAALNCLARRDYAEPELQKRLQKAGFEISEIQTVTTELIQKKLLSNARFIENYIHYRRKKGFGPLKIEAELHEKGLTSAAYRPFLNPRDPAWLSEAANVHRKKFKDILPDNFAARAKQIRFLQGRGFTSDQIEHLFKKIDYTDQT